MVIVPKEVDQDFTEITKGFKHSKVTMKVHSNSNIYSEGVQAGKDAMQSKKLTA